MKKTNKIHPLVKSSIILQMIVWVIGLFYFDSISHNFVILCTMMVAVNMIVLIEKKYFLVLMSMQTLLWTAPVLLVLFGHLHRDYMIIALPFLILNIFALAKIWKTRTENTKKIHPLVNTAIIAQTIAWVVGLIYFDSINHNLAILYAMMVAVNIIFLIEKKYFSVPIVIQTLFWASAALLMLLGHRHKDYLIVALPFLMLNIFALAEIWKTRTRKHSKKRSKKKLKG